MMPFGEIVSRRSLGANKRHRGTDVPGAKPGRAAKIEFLLCSRSINRRK